MKVTPNWLKHYVDLVRSHEELSVRLTILGLPVLAKQRILPA
jgi:hypothetical protein